MPIFIFLIMSMEIYNIATKVLMQQQKKKKNIETNIMNNSAKCQLYPLYSFWGVDFFNFFFFLQILPFDCHGNQSN